MSLEDALPGLRESEYRITSPRTRKYNCIAWSVHDITQWLWPGPIELSDWPAEIQREETLEAFESMFHWLGFVPESSEDGELGVEKVALFARSSGLPTHAARQLPSGRWTSKLGKAEDIEHDLHALEGDVYGTVVRIFRRPVTPTPS